MHEEWWLGDLTVSISLARSVSFTSKSWKESSHPEFQSLAFMWGVPLTSRELLKIYGVLWHRSACSHTCGASGELPINIGVMLPNHFHSSSSHLTDTNKPMSFVKSTWKWLLKTKTNQQGWIHSSEEQTCTRACVYNLDNADAQIISIFIAGCAIYQHVIWGFLYLSWGRTAVVLEQWLCGSAGQEHLANALFFC